MKKIILLALFSMLAACQANGVTATSTPSEDTGPITVIDFPASGASLPFGDVVIQAHADDPLGVTHGEISIDNLVLANVESLHLGERTALFSYSWHPGSAGEFSLSVRAQNTAGTWGAPATVQIALSSPTPTATEMPPTPTTTPTALLATPTQTPTIPPPTSTTVVTSKPLITLTPTLSGPTLTPSFTALQFYAAGSKCYPQDSGMTVEVSDLSKVAGVMVFFMLVNPDTGETTAWTGGYSLYFAAGNRFYQTLTSANIFSRMPWLPAKVWYQFVAIDKDHLVIQRTQVYGDMTILKCA
jgi:hypothetical protein